MKIFRSLICLGTLFTLVGCVSAPPHRPEPQYRPVWPQVQAPKPASPGSLYMASHNLTLFDDRRAGEVGDVITIILDEQTRSSKSAETSFSKATTNEILNPKVLTAWCAVLVQTIF